MNATFSHAAVHGLLIIVKCLLQEKKFYIVSLHWEIDSEGKAHKNTRFVEWFW